MHREAERDGKLAYTKARSQGPAGHSQRPVLMKLLLRKQKGKSPLRSLTPGHLRGGVCVVWCLAQKEKKRGWKQAESRLGDGK